MKTILGFNSRQQIITNFLIMVMTVFILIGVGMISGCSIAKKNDELFYANPSFSHDGQKLTFDRYSDSSHPQIHIFDLKSKTLTYLQSEPGVIRLMASFSPNGRQLVFSQVPILTVNNEAESLDWDNSQIGIMDVDGGNVRIMTKGPGVKKAGNFSWSGKKVIYMQGKIRKPNSKTRDSDNDVYEVDLETGISRQLTNLQFFQAGRPTYLPDDKSFVIGADYPANISGLTNMEYWSYMKELTKKNNNSRVQRFDVVDKSEELNTLFTDLFYADNVDVDAMGNIYFEAYPGVKGRSHIFKFSSDGQFNSWPIDRHFQTVGTRVSPDGRRWVVVSRPTLENDPNGIYVFDFGTGAWEEIPAHGPAKPINP